MSKLTPEQMLNKARQYVLADGYSVIPVGLDKRPLLSSWKEYQTRKPTEEELTSWWDKYPFANIGIVTGKVSGIIVVDIDTYKKDYTAIDYFPETFTIETGNKGYHLFYNYVEGFTISANAYESMPGVDLRSDGGFVVAVPSVTSYLKDSKQSGGEYVIFKNLKMADFPIELFPKVKKARTLKDTVGVQAGGRNDSLASIIGKLLLSSKEEVWYSEVLPAIEAIAKTYKPALPMAEVHTTFESIVKKEKSRLEDEREKNEENTQEEVEIRTKFIKDKTKATHMMARYLTKMFNIITVGEKEREMYVYRNGVYFRAENEIIYPEIQRILGDYVTKNAKTETFHKIADMTSYPRDVFYSAPLNLIPLANGVYDRVLKVLLPHDPIYRFTYQFPIIFDNEKQCQKTSAFLDQVLTPEQRATVEEWMGYYFHRLYMFKKAIIFVGEGDTGKTTLLEVVTHMLGRDNISSVSLQKMTGDKFAAAHLYEKHGNLVDELSAKDIVDTGNFKIATGGGSISGEYKFGNQFSFSNFSKFTFACNKIPDVKDFDDEAYFNRWMVIRFEKKIEKRIPNFIQLLTTEEERSGLFNLAMIGLDRLLQEEKFTYAKSAVDTKLEMMRSGSSIATFVAESIEHEVGAEMTKEDMYEAYTAYCAQNALAAETIKMFGTKFLFYVSYASEGLVNEVKNGKFVRVRGWRNVGLIKSPEEKERNDADKAANEKFELSMGIMPTVEEMTADPTYDEGN